MNSQTSQGQRRGAKTQANRSEGTNKRPRSKKTKIEKPTNSRRSNRENSTISCNNNDNTEMDFSAAGGISINPSAGMLYQPSDVYLPKSPAEHGAHFQM